VVWLQNIGEKGVKWRMRERKWNLLGVSASGIYDCFNRLD